MTFVPSTATKLSQPEADALLARRQQVAGAASPRTKQSFVMRAANAVTDFVGARGIADQFGASGAEAALRLAGNSDASAQVEHPDLKKVVGSAIQTGANLIPIAKGATLTGKVLGGLAVGQLADTGSDLQEGKTVGEALQPGANAAVNAAMPFAGVAFRQIGRLIGKTGDKIQFSVIKPVKEDIEDGFSIETVKKYDLGGSIKTAFRKTEDKLAALSQELNQKLEKATASVDLADVFDRTKKRLLGNKLEAFGTNTQLGTQIERLGDEIAAVTPESPLLAVKDANLVKRAAGHFGAWQYGAPDPEAKARERVFNVFYNELKQEIENQSPAGVKELNQQMSEIIPVMNALIRRIPVAERNNAISLTDIITLTAAGFEPRLAALSLANIASKSGTVGNFLSKKGERIANSEHSALRDLLTKISAQGMADD